MLDVHPPHERMHGFGDFLLHLLTITVGLLIAVGIEGCVEWRHHVHLANDARETMHAEIEKNAKTLDGALVSIKAEREAMQRNADAMTKIQRNDKDPANQDARLSGDFHLTGLENTAWRTAQATGALAWMPYDEAQRFSSVYQSQEAFIAHQEKLQEDSALFLGLVNRTDPDKGHLTSAEAAILNERFGIWQGDLLTLDLAARVADAEDHAVLEGHAMPKELHESLIGK
jgi:hypothetical protein